MTTELFMSDCSVSQRDAKSLIQDNPFLGGECVLKKCCKKYKKSKRCKKCPD